MRWRLIVIIATLVVFSPVVRHEFGGWDDEQNLTLNPQMNPPTLAAVASYWRAPKFDLYVPLTWTVWSALARAGYIANAPSPDAHLNPYIFHSASLALHATSALLAFELLRRLLGRDALVASAAGALMFALHPVQAEPVAWVSGLKDVLSGTFSLAAMILFLDSTRDARTEWQRYLLAMIAFALALLSKPSAVVVPAMVITLDVLIRQSPIRRSVVRFWPALLLMVAAAILARVVQQAPHLPAVDWAKRPIIAFDAIAFYLSKFIWPLNLGVHYGRTPQHVLSINHIEWFWFTPIILIAALITRNRFVLAAVAILLIGIVPVLGLVPFDFQEYSTVADHYLYLAMLGPALLLALFVDRTNRSAIGVIIVAICAALSFRQSLTWHDARSISEQAVKANPKSKPWSDRLNQLLIQSANSQADRGDYIGAILTYRRVMRRDPSNPGVPSDMASICANSGDLGQAIFWYEVALSIDPTFEPARTGLARARSDRKHSTTR